MKKLVKSIFAFSSLMFLTACDSPYPIKYLYVDVDLLDGNKSQTVKVPVDSTFKELIGDYNKRGCTLTHFEDQKGNKFSLEDKIELTEDQFYKAVYTVDQDEIMETNDEMLNKHGDLRIMSFNVLSDDWNNKPKMHGYDAHNDKYPDGVDDGRDIQAWDTLQTFKPDVIGVQEFDDEWYKAFKDFKNNGNDIPYTPVNEDELKYTLDGRQQTIYTTILYNPETVELVSWKHTRFQTADSNTNCRSFTYGIFKGIEDGQQFAVINSHWNHLDSSLSTTAQKETEQAEETAGAYDFLSRGLGFPTIAVGDMNQIDSHHSYKTLLSTSGFQDLKYEANTKGLMCDTYNIGNGEASEPGKWYRGIDSMLDTLVNTVEARDHILGNRYIKSMYYETVTTEKALNSSDHMPIFADVNILN